MAAGTLTQFLVGALGPVLIPSLGLSRTEFGVVTATFFVAAAILSPLAGRLSDDWGGQPLLVVTFLFAGLGFGTMSAAQSAVGLVVGCVLAGVAGATANPATNLLVAEAAPRGSQGTLLGIKQSGVQVGAFAAGMLPALSQVLGWRWVLVGCGIVCASGVATAVPGYRRRDRRAARRDARPPAVGTPTPDHITPWLGPYAALMGMGGAAVSTYLPLYAFEVGGFSVALAGLLAALVGLVGIPARIVWARTSERGRESAGPLAVIAAGSVVSVLLMLAALFGPGSVLWLAAITFGASGAAWNSVGMLAIIRQSESGFAGRVSGRVLTGFYIGLVVGPVPFGFAVDRTGSYSAGWSAVIAVYALGGLLALLWRRRLVHQLQIGSPEVAD
jgi:MFS family permease